MAFEATIHVRALKDGSAAYLTFKGRDAFHGETRLPGPLVVAGSGEAARALMAAVALDAPGPHSQFPIDYGEDWRLAWPAVRAVVLALTYGEKAPLELVEASPEGPVPSQRILKGKGVL